MTWSAQPHAHPWPDPDCRTCHPLTPGQWQAVDAIVATHSPSPDLVRAVEQATAAAWANHPKETP